MSDIWIFSPSSEQLLKRCTDAAQPEDTENEWVKKFKRKHDKYDENKDILTENDNSDVIELSDSNIECSNEEKVLVLPAENYEEILEIIDTEPVAKFDYLVEECLKNNKLLSKLAEKLSTTSIEKTFAHLFNVKDANPTFLEDLYQIFFPRFLKREYSRLSFDLLVKADKAYPLQFKKLLCVLLKDVEIPNKILQDYVQILETNNKQNFIKTVTEIDLSPEKFTHNLFAVYTAYKDCKKNDSIQKCMENLITKNAEFCSNEKNFGKLLLTFLQEEKNFGAKNCRIGKAVEINKTPFKKPCLNILKDICK